MVHLSCPSLEVVDGWALVLEFHPPRVAAPVPNHKSEGPVVFMPEVVVETRWKSNVRLAEIASTVAIICVRQLGRSYYLDRELQAR